MLRGGHGPARFQMRILDNKTVLGSSMNVECSTVYGISCYNCIYSFKIKIGFLFRLLEVDIAGEEDCRCRSVPTTDDTATHAFPSAKDVTNSCEESSRLFSCFIKSRMLLLSPEQPKLAARLSRGRGDVSRPPWEERWVVAFGRLFKLQLIPLSSIIYK